MSHIFTAASPFSVRRHSVMGTKESENNLRLIISNKVHQNPYKKLKQWMDARIPIDLGRLEYKTTELDQFLFHT